MNSASKPRTGQILALLILTALLALVYGAVAQPLLSSYFGYREVIDSKRAQLQRYQKIIARGQWAGEALQRMRMQGQQRAYYLPGGTSALASAKLQEYVKRLARASHGELISTQVLSQRRSGEVPSVTLRVQMKGGLDTLLNMFYAIETGTPVVVLENVVIASHGTRRLVANQAGRYVDELDIRFDLVGYTYGGKD
ncbi:MAG: type II secretion system protein GspM [Gammaproteobacteria bacterium]